jgi:Skp family chaperone for outer membrane proteins
MAKEHLATYLNDHLAGSVVALELLDHLESSYSESELNALFKQLRDDIDADQDELKNLMKRLDLAESRTRKASAWFTEKITELKLRLDDPKGGSLRLFESLEALSLGIEGKRSLWMTLIVVAENSPALGTLDYERLVRRAQEQRDRVETRRIETARKALTFD